MSRPEEPRVVVLGLDFDNTLVSYDEIFHRAARERGLLDAGVPANKTAVRDALRAGTGGNDAWTELQGVVYGKLLSDAPPTPGVEDFLERCREARVRMQVISHKTRVPAAGPPYDLHEAARTWLRLHRFAERFGIPEERWFFETTLAGKLERIRTAGCTHFVDDLEELLEHADFPQGVIRLHYCPAGAGGGSGLARCGSWREVEAHVLGSP